MESPLHSGSGRSASFTDESGNGRAAFFTHLREVSQTPTPVGNVLTDPKWIRALTPRPKSRSSKHAHSSKSKEGPDTSALIQMVFHAEERQTNELKMLLRTTGDRLEFEMQRADAADMRANFIEERMRDCNQRIAELVAAQHQSQLNIARLTEEAKRYSMVIDSLEAEIERANTIIDEAKHRRRRAEKETRDANDLLRKYEQALTESRIHDITRQQERYVNGVVEGRQEGYESAKRVEREKRRAIYLQGFEAGRTTGFQEGKVYGQYYDAPVGKASYVTENPLETDSVTELPAA